MRPALVVLAAGASRRLGECKALARIGGRSALEHLLAAGAVLAPPAPLVVTGADDAAIAARLPPGAGRLFNPRWAEGRSGGLRLAHEARPGFDLAVAPVDCPLVPAAVFEALAEAWRAAGSPARGWLAPAHGAPPRHGHPVVVGRALLAELEGLPGDLSLRALRSRATPLLAVEVDAPEVLDDLDLPADLEALRRRLAGPVGGSEPGGR